MSNQVLMADKAQISKPPLADKGTQASGLSLPDQKALTPKKFLTAYEIHQRLSQLFTLERKTTAQIVEYLLEVKRRRVYLEFGYTGLFSYLTKHFKHTEATAQRWIECVRMTEKVPEICHDLESGSLNQTQVCMMAQSIREKEKQGVSVDTKKLLPQVRNQTAAQTQVIIAQALDLAPKTHEKKSYQQDESIRFEITLTKEQITQVNRVKELLSHKYPHLTMAELISVMAQEIIKKRDPLVQKGRNQGAVKIQKAAKAGTAGTVATAETAETAGTDNHPTSKLEADSFDREASKLEVQGSDKETSKLKVDSFDKEIFESKVKSLPKIEAQSSNTDTSKLEIHDLDKEASKLEVQGCDKETSKLEVPRSIRRSIPRAIRRAVYQRDLCCQWKLGNNQICGSRFQLQVDHIQPLWAGGGHSLENTQILCSLHNRQKYRREAGVKWT